MGKYQNVELSGYNQCMMNTKMGITGCSKCMY